MYVILPAIESSLVWLAVAGLLTSVISCYYYLRVVKFMYFDEPQEPLDITMPHGVRAGLYISFAVVVLFFVTPGPLVNSAKMAASVLLQ
jgi:NADH-quinone oxidoreductase subunit N